MGERKETDDYDSENPNYDPCELLTAFLLGPQRPQLDENSLPPAAMLQEAEELILEYFRTNYNLVPRHSISQRTIGTNTEPGWMQDKAVQTDPVPLSQCAHTPTPGPSTSEPIYVTQNPFNPFRTHAPNPKNPFGAPAPIPPTQRIPSLLKIKVPTPPNVDSHTLDFLGATSQSGCWNCKKPGHRYSKCPLDSPLGVFCRRCGEPGFTVGSCPNRSRHRHH